jgi:holo-[acyl-carrier protein] synthase
LIAGIGVDIVDIGRIRALYERYGERFLKRVFSPEEIRHCTKRMDPPASLAARFAAKEAFVKALGTGMTRGMRFHDIQVTGPGQPQIKLSGKARHLAEQMGIMGVHVSLSHERTHAVAMVIVEVRP